MTLEEAKKYVDNIYQHKFDGITKKTEEGTTVYIGGLKEIKFSDFEIASFRLLRAVGRLEYENMELEVKINDALEYINNACYSPEFNKDYLDNLINILKRGK